MPQPAGRDTTDTKNSPAARRRCQNAQRRVAMKKKNEHARRRVEKKHQKKPGGGTTSADRRLDKTKIEQRVGTAAPRTSASGPVRDQHPSRPTPPPETPGAGWGRPLRCNCMEQRCGAEFLMSAAAVVSYTKKGWPTRKRCYANTAGKKARAKQRKQQRRKPGTPTPAPAAAGAPPQPPADVVSESGGTWRAEAAGAVAAVHAADHGVADVFVAPEGPCSVFNLNPDYNMARADLADEAPDVEHAEQCTWPPWCSCGAFKRFYNANPTW